MRQAGRGDDLIGGIAPEVQVCERPAERVVSEQRGLPPCQIAGQRVEQHMGVKIEHPTAGP